MAPDEEARWRASDRSERQAQTAAGRLGWLLGASTRLHVRTGRVAFIAVAYAVVLVWAFGILTLVYDKPIALSFEFAGPVTIIAVLALFLSIPARRFTPRLPDYSVSLDASERADRRSQEVMLVDILSPDEVLAADRATGPGEDELYWFLYALAGPRQPTAMKRQMRLAAEGHNVTHRLDRSLWGTYPDTIRALVGALQHHEHKVLSLADAAAGAHIEAYMARLSRPGENGHLSFDVALVKPMVRRTDVQATAECKGVKGKWERGRDALEHVLEDTDRLLKGEAPKERGWRAFRARLGDTFRR